MRACLEQTCSLEAVACIRAVWFLWGPYHSHGCQGHAEALVDLLRATNALTIWVDKLQDPCPYDA